MKAKNNLNILTKKKKSFACSPVKAVIILLFIEASVYSIWAMSRPEPVETVEKDQYVTLQEQVESLKKDLLLKTNQYSSLQKKNQDLTRKQHKGITIAKLPVQVQSSSEAQTLEKIRKICTEFKDVNRLNVGALLAVLRQIQTNKVINTSQPAKDKSHQTLYQQIQTVLNAVDSHNGPITNVQADTFKAVKAFQTQNKLKVDGKIGMQTFMGIVKIFEAKRLKLGTVRTPVTKKEAANGLRSKMPISKHILSVRKRSNAAS